MEFLAWFVLVAGLTGIVLSFVVPEKQIFAMFGVHDWAAVWARITSSPRMTASVALGIAAELAALTLALVVLASLVTVRALAGRIGEMRRYLDLFFLGAAFLLLETKNVAYFALLFGTTWFVNALVFAAILASVYLAIEVARRVRFTRPLRLYGMLIASLAVAWAVPSSALLGLPVGTRFLAAAAIAFIPVFIANLVFAERFRDVGSSAVAFGSNLLGAMVGGILEYSALTVGYRGLLVVAAVLYGAAFAAGRGELQRAPVARADA